MSAPRHTSAVRPNRRARQRRRMAHRRRRWLRWRSLLVIPALAVFLLGVSLAGAAVAPGNVSFEAKWADWLPPTTLGGSRSTSRSCITQLTPLKGGQAEGLEQGASHR